LFGRRDKRSCRPVWRQLANKDLRLRKKEKMFEYYLAGAERETTRMILKIVKQKNKHMLSGYSKERVGGEGPSRKKRRCRTEQTSEGGRRKEWGRKKKASKATFQALKGKRRTNTKQWKGKGRLAETTTTLKPGLRKLPPSRRHRAEKEEGQIRPAEIPRNGYKRKRKAETCADPRAVSRGERRGDWSEFWEAESLRRGHLDDRKKEKHPAKDHKKRTCEKRSRKRRKRDRPCLKPVPENERKKSDFSLTNPFTSETKWMERPTQTKKL